MNFPPKWQYRKRPRKNIKIWRQKKWHEILVKFVCSTSFLLYAVCSFICFISFNGGCFTTYIVHFVRSWCRIFKSPISLYALIILFNTFNRDRQRWNSIDVNERAYVVRNNQVHLIPPFALLGEHGCVVWGFNELFLLNFSCSFHVSSSHHILPQSACSALVSLVESLFCQCLQCYLCCWSLMN